MHTRCKLNGIKKLIIIVYILGAYPRIFKQHVPIFSVLKHTPTNVRSKVVNVFDFAYLRLMSDKAQGLSQRVDVLSRRSIREKLLCYFRQLAEKEGDDTVTLPFSLSTLADYIATDRSAMMRELKKLKDEGLISADGRQIRLLS